MHRLTRAGRLCHGDGVTAHEGWRPVPGAGLLAERTGDDQSRTLYVYEHTYYDRVKDDRSPDRRLTPLTAGGLGRGRVRPTTRHSSWVGVAHADELPGCSERLGIAVRLP